jgi:hypothetical protein
MKLLIEDDAGRIVGEISKVESIDLSNKPAKDYLIRKIKEIILRKKRTVSMMPAVKADV